MTKPNKDLIKSFKTSQDFNKWLEVNHDSKSELWMKIYKKGSDKKSINWNEAVIEALCWGWIDGTKKTFDESSYLQRFTPRRKGSLWSKRNREHVERLIKEGKMKDVGIIHVNEAKLDGRWESAYAPSSEMKIPDDFLDALEKIPNAKEFFKTLNKQNLYTIFYQLQTAKRSETRQKRFDKLLNKLINGEKP